MHDETETLAAFIADAQTRLRAIATKYPARFAALTDPKNYATRSVRRSIDECARATFVDVIFTWPNGLDVAGSLPVATTDSAYNARMVIEGRCAA